MQLMNPRIHQIITSGESRTVEFKRAGGGLGASLYETICAFLNREGGDILLGVSDKGRVLGIDPDRLPAMVGDFANFLVQNDLLVLEIDFATSVEKTKEKVLAAAVDAQIEA